MNDTFPKITTEGIKTDLLLTQRIHSLVDAVKSVQQRLDDMVLEAQCVLVAATAFYTSLSRMMDVDVKLESALTPIIEPFAIGRRKTAAAEDR